MLAPSQPPGPPPLNPFVEPFVGPRLAFGGATGACQSPKGEKRPQAPPVFVAPRAPAPLAFGSIFGPPLLPGRPPPPDCSPPFPVGPPN
ncbi:hypothetical protein PBY51_013847 [Eleginops maclovinus]|uniref:Uncharacterized protein n=1 Tax=Eleginops maclovinus TaxID=56733 RepID=A0AAN7Y7L6_ELEMC|nr:hypothetical protein PBY51_013847 [Eleginops maclovinus]